MTFLLAVTVAIGITIKAPNTAGITVVLDDVPTVADDPGSPPPRPRSRAPAAPRR